MSPHTSALSGLPSPASAPASRDERDETFVVPLHEETLSVARREIETGRVRVKVEIHERQEIIEQDLAQETVEIERVPVGRVIAETPSIREEDGGAVIVIPVVEEVLVVERRLVLKEEVRVRRVRSTARQQQNVTVRSEEAVVTRLPAAADAGDAEQASGHADPKTPNHPGKQ